MPTRDRLDKSLELCRKSYNEPNIRRLNSSAYVEVNNGLVEVAFTGTDDALDWLFNLNAVQDTLGNLIKDRLAGKTIPNINIHQGFFDYVIAIYDDVTREIGNRKFTLTGHSLGGVSATIFAIIHYSLTGIKPELVVTFGSPRGFYGDTQYYESSIPHTYRVAVVDDAAVFLPPLVLGWKHVGIPILYDILNESEPSFMPKGYDDDQLLTFLKSETYKSIGSLAKISAIRTVILRLLDNYLAYSGLIESVPKFTAEKFYNYIFSNTSTAQEDIDNRIGLVTKINDILQTVKGTGSWEAELERIAEEELGGADLDTDEIFSFATNLQQGLLPIIKQVADAGIPFFKRYMEQIQGIDTESYKLQEAVEVLSDQLGFTEGSVYASIREGIAFDDIFDDKNVLEAFDLYKLYESNIERLEKLIEEGIEFTDKIKYTTAYISLSFQVLSVTLKWLTRFTYSKYIYNMLSAIRFHSLDIYKGLIDKMPIEKINIMLDDFNNKYKFVGHRGDDILYRDKDGKEYILKGDKTETYLESIDTEPKILGYIIYTPGVVTGSVVTWEG